MKKILLISLIPLVLCSCNDTTSDSSSTSSSSGGEQKLTIDEKFTNYLAKFDNLDFDDANKVTYQSTSVQSVGIEIEWTQNGTATLYKNNFYHEEAVQKVEEQEIDVIYEKGETTYNNNDVFYNITYYGKGDSDNETVFYAKGTATFSSFACVSFKAYYLNSFLGYAYSNYLTNKDSGKYAFTLECDNNDVDFKTDGTKTLNFKYQIVSGTTIVNELKSDDTIEIQNGKVISSKSSYWLTTMNAANYITCARDASYSYDESIKTYEGDKLNPLDYISE